MKLYLLACASLCSAQSVTIHTGTLIDGKGGVQRNVVVGVEGSKIARIEPAGSAKSTYDLSSLTLMPGWIDTHAHPNTHFDKNNRFVDGNERHLPISASIGTDPMAELCGLSEAIDDCIDVKLKQCQQTKLLL